MSHISSGKNYIKDKWAKFKKLLNYVLGAPQPLPLPEQPQTEMITSETVRVRFETELARYNQNISEHKKAHEEISKIIRRIFYALVGTCLFCVITLSGMPDAELIVMSATVKLPILNYVR